MMHGVSGIDRPQSESGFDLSSILDHPLKLHDDVVELECFRKELEIIRNCLLLLPLTLDFIPEHFAPIVPPILILPALEKRVLSFLQWRF